MMSRRHVLEATALVLLTASAAWAEPTVGLAERRAIAAYRQDRYPAYEKAIQDAAGMPVPVEVAWDQLTIPGDAKYYADEGYFGKTIFEPIAAGLKEVGKDKMGRDALAQKLKAIRIRFDEKTAPASNYPNGLTFEGGTLDVNWRPFSNVADFKDRVDAVVKVLEKNL
ncbi:MULTISPECIES: hypothetical protein [unclassified Methylobacterium]|uniref:hypothetical protein n=1 Tax=unclassified Methylobacterium TaxID=2615210 RepID=UPI0006F9257C|nr:MULTISPECIES: hypothetical protein [unclassified Methylobacterium]KQO54143.1 hypothetical protein ASF08_16130 [Methylobacterium sp. Leaf85]KQP00963.1 hypothetical protein ASF26_15450 [Methylobacterium sp. Leaf93]